MKTPLINRTLGSYRTSLGASNRFKTCASPADESAGVDARSHPTITWLIWPKVIRAPPAVTPFADLTPSDLIFTGCIFVGGRSQLAAGWPLKFIASLPLLGSLPQAVEALLAGHLDCNKAK